MRKLFVVVVAASATLAACSSNETTATPVLASVTVVPGTDSVPGGDTMLALPTAHLAAVLKDAGGHVMSVVQTGQSVVWTSSATTVATVARYGVVRGLTLGSTTITAAIEGKSAASVVTVDTLVTVASVQVTPAPDTVKAGKTVDLTARPFDARGDTLKVRVMTWTSSDTTLATVTGSTGTGTVKGRAAGSVTIRATIAGVSGTATVVVLP